MQLHHTQGLTLLVQLTVFFCVLLSAPQDVPDIFSSVQFIVWLWRCLCPFAVSMPSLYRMLFQGRLEFCPGATHVHFFSEDMLCSFVARLKIV